MIAFRQTTIKAKLITLTMLPSTIGLLFFFGPLRSQRYCFSFRRQMVRDLSTWRRFWGPQQRRVGFCDEAQATKTLSALAARRIWSPPRFIRRRQILGRYHRPERVM